MTNQKELVQDGIDQSHCRLRSHRMGSPPAQLHHLMPPSHPGHGGVMQHHQPQDNVHDQLRLLPANSGLSPVSSMKYPGTPPDTPPCSSSPSPHYQEIGRAHV